MTGLAGRDVLGDTARVKIAAGLVACVLLLAGCSSAGNNQAASTPTSSGPAVITASETYTAPSYDPTADKQICAALITVDDPATQLTLLTQVTEIVRFGSNNNAANVDARIADLTKLEGAAGAAYSDLAPIVGDLSRMLSAVKEAVAYGTTVDPSVTYSAASEDERQIRTFCGRIGVV